MANENANDWAMDTAVVTETVKAAEAFLKEHPILLEKNDGWIGKQIADFLGGVFTEQMIGNALSIIHAVAKKEVDEKAVKAIKEPTKAAEFVRAVKQSEKPIPVSDQRAMAKARRPGSKGRGKKGSLLVEKLPKSAERIAKRASETSNSLRELNRRHMTKGQRA